MNTKGGVYQRFSEIFRGYKKYYEIDEETGEEVVREYYVESKYFYTVHLTFYNDITRGRAKRIARNHYLRFRPSDCGTNSNKMKDKKYLPSAKFVYTSKNRKLVIRIMSKVKHKTIKKILKEEYLDG